jgi:hypothetical protein
MCAEMLCYVRLGCDINGPVRVVDFSSLLLLYDSLLANYALTSLASGMARLARSEKAVFRPDLCWLIYWTFI